MRQKYAYFNGKITEFKNVKISPYDIGFLRGYGVFDVMRTQNGKLFLPAEHWKSFRNSAQEVGIKIPITQDSYAKIVEKLLRLNGFKESVVRTVLTGGVSENSFKYIAGKETMVVLIEEFKPLPAEIFEKGTGVVTLEHDREFPRAKNNNYIAAIKNQKQKEKKRALEMIYVKDGKISEASTSNFFIVKGRKVITTKDGILFGTTRNLAVRLVKKAGYAVEERNITEKEIYAADEAFLTATLKTIVPVVRIDDKKVGGGKVGKITRELIEIFAEFAKAY